MARDPRRTVVRGRLVYDTPENYGRRQFSGLRCAVWTTLVLVLYISNPANNNNEYDNGWLAFASETGQRLGALLRSTPLSSWWDAVSVELTASVAAARRRNSQHQPVLRRNTFEWSSTKKIKTTNFGLFCVEEIPTVELIVRGGGFDWHCSFHEKEETVPSSSFSLAHPPPSFCRDILRQYMSHQKPILYDPDDRAHTAHRIAVWLLVAATFASSCFTRPLTIHTGNFFFTNSLAGFFFDTYDEFHTPSNSLGSFVSKLASLNAMVFPAIQAMDAMVQQQNSNSMFAFFPSTDANFALSLAVLLGIAMAMSALSRSWSGASHRLVLSQFDALVAASLGFFAQYQANEMVVLRLQTMRGLQLDESVWYFVSWLVLGFQLDEFAMKLATWTLIAQIALQRSIATAVFFCLTHCLGQMTFHYQLEHMTIFLTARAFSNSFQCAGRMIEECISVLFGSPLRSDQKMW